MYMYVCTRLSHLLLCSLAVCAYRHVNAKCPLSMTDYLCILASLVPGDTCEWGSSLLHTHIHGVGFLQSVAYLLWFVCPVEVRQTDFSKECTVVDKT